MRNGAWLGAAVFVAACSSGSGSKDTATLILNDPTWDRVNVQVVFTTSADCDNRGPGYDRMVEITMRKNKTERFEAKNGESICWRHDRNPNNPSAGAWSGWSKVTLFPGQEIETEL
ncbi:MAG: hypothetical protein JO267_16035 [Alphaproteobacteria bacterium]|nr:hypothetical protein [Alphaproteobacteria bacterium]MBV9863649.1 hypothetical protein [Alphaproteobacteria bacterium]